MAKINGIREEIQNVIRIEARNMIRYEADDIKNQLEELKKCGPIDITQMNELNAELMAVETENSELRSKISEMIKTMSQLNVNINTLDQSMREANIEIYGLPELKNENLPAIVIKLAKVVSLRAYDLKDSDILKCVRVVNNRLHPHSVVVKLCSARLRDELYAAVIRYNKSHPDDKLNTTVLGYPGRKMPVYVTEHRSPISKS